MNTPTTPQSILRPTTTLQSTDVLPSTTFQSTEVVLTTAILQSTEVTLPARSAVIPDYGIALLTVGAALTVLVMAALVIILGAKGWLAKRKNKVLPEFSATATIL